MRSVELNDKYTQADGTILLSGVQALVRLPLIQRERDRQAGLDTAGFISGYRGSPIGSYDMELWRAAELLKSNDIVFQPGVNEDLAATAVWGTQMLDSVPQANKDGVFAIWYGKGPGVDRSGDPFKHGNVAGTHPNGGVLVVAGDDHTGKSSTVAHQSEYALMHAGMPILSPSNVQDVLDFGIFGFAMSRYTGLYSGFKTTNETLEQTMTVSLADTMRSFELPERGEEHAFGFHNYPTHLDRIQSAIVHQRYRWPLIGKFVRANGLDRVLIAAPRRRLGLVSAGKAVQDTRQALELLGLDHESAAALGISFYQLGCVYPVEPLGLAEFSRGQQELLFVEEKAPIAEEQSKAALYGGEYMPRIVGKRDEAGEMMIPSDVQLEPAQLAIVIAERLKRMGVDAVAVFERSAQLASRIATIADMKPADAARSPYFCSGCPHNTGTRFPDGSMAAGGIGCHAMAMYSGPKMMPNSQMGGEGAHWYSLHHFSDMPHLFQNMGDGTYYHSGLLAVRGAVAAKAPMTFKILFNDAVAMTGGQSVDGPLSVGDITRQVMAEGVDRCVVVSDRPDLYGPESKLAPGVEVHDRDDYDTVQRNLMSERGVTVIVYEQTCAAEKRRRRKRGKFPDPPKRYFINSDVCEGCGDCSAKSNCVSVWPKETELGRKRMIDQSSCNKDYSCVKGFCPSFVTVLDAEPRKPTEAELPDIEAGPLPEIAPITLTEDSYNIMISGIGGTGVVTIGALLGMAAHLDGLGCSIFDMTGLSQKNGAVYSHVRIAKTQERLAAQKLGAGEANLALAFDAVAALSPEPGVTLDPERSVTIVNARLTPTPAFQRNPDMTLDQGLLMKRLDERSLALHGVDASGLGLALLGDTIAANLFLLGWAAQHGLLPVSTTAIERAVELNGVAVPFNLRAFALGRSYAISPDRIDAAVRIPEAEFRPLEDLGEIIAHRVGLLTDYQSYDWAERYRALVARIERAEAATAGDDRSLSIMVARNFAKLMSYKDEYEVARLFNSQRFRNELERTFEPGAKIRYNLAPPIFARRDKATGELQKREFGPWIGTAFRFLEKMKGLRGTGFDPFGRTEERRMERRLIDQYEVDMMEVANTLTQANRAAAIELASLPAQIRGYGHIKEQNATKVAKLRSSVLKRFHKASEISRHEDAAA